MTILRVILGDQLSDSLSSLKGCNRAGGGNEALMPGIFSLTRNWTTFSRKSLSKSFFKEILFS